jgi:thiol-disulfide isomerase/thioredoxin
MAAASAPFRHRLRFGTREICTGLAVFLLAGCGPTETPDPQAKIERQSSQAVTFPQPSNERVDRSNAGMPAPDSLFQDPAGEPASIPQFAGKAVLLNLWATWCGPCVVEMPALDALAAREKNIVVLAVSQDPNGQKDVQAFFAHRDFRKLQPNIDPELTLMTRLGIDTLPTTILYDASGREVWRMKGMADWQGQSAARLIAEAAMLGPTSPERHLAEGASKPR